MKKQRVLLQVDYLTGKIYAVEEYSGDGKGVDAMADGLDIIEKAEKNGLDLYYRDGQIVSRPKDENEYRNKINALYAKLKKLNKEERKAFAEYSLSGSNCDSDKLRKVFESGKRLRIKIKGIKDNRNALIRQTVNDKINSAKFKYYCSVCLIIKDDNEYLEEWLNWHIGQGVEHFYIYDHGSEQPVSKFMQTLPQDVQEKVTVIAYGGSHDFAQHDAYNDCLKNYAKESRWIGFIDSDEMVRVKDGTPLTRFLKDYEEYAALFIGWILYDANGQIKKDGRPVRERFANPAPENSQQGMGKVFVQPYCTAQMLTHNCYPVEGYGIVDEYRDNVDEGIPCKLGLSTDKICIDHYYTKSYEEWVKKISRGRCDPYYSRKYEEFFEINPDLWHCREEIFPEQIYEKNEIKGKQK